MNGGDRKGGWCLGGRDGIIQKGTTVTELRGEINRKDRFCRGWYLPGMSCSDCGWEIRRVGYGRAWYLSSMSHNGWGET